MPKQFAVRYTVTEITREEIVIEAESAEEAKRRVAGYEFDNSGSNFYDVILWTVSDVEVVEEITPEKGD